MRNLAIPVLILAAACSSNRSVVTLEGEMRGETAVAMDGPGGSVRSVAATTGGGSTTLRIDGTRVTCLGHEGYRGSLGERTGKVTVGDVVLEYDATELRVDGPTARGVYTLCDGLDVTVEPSGATRTTIRRASR